MRLGTGKTFLLIQSPLTASFLFNKVVRSIPDILVLRSRKYQETKMTKTQSLKLK